MLKPTQWSLSSKARMCTGRFGRLLFASEREATSTIPSLLQSGTIHSLYTVVLMKETTFETGTITDIWHLTLVQQISTWEGPWLARKLVRAMTRMSLMSMLEANSGSRSKIQNISANCQQTQNSHWKKLAIWYCEGVYGCQTFVPSQPPH